MARIDNFLRDIVELDRRVRKLETVKQPLGGDIVQIGESNVASTGQLLLVQGQEIYFTVTLTPDVARLSLYNLAISLYVDNDNNAAYLWSSGASLSSGQRKVKLTCHLDYASSSEVTGERKYMVTLRNEDTASHYYYLYTKSYNIATPTS